MFTWLKRRREQKRLNDEILHKVIEGTWEIEIKGEGVIMFGGIWGFQTDVGTYINLAVASLVPGLHIIGDNIRIIEFDPENKRIVAGVLHLAGRR